MAGQIDFSQPTLYISAASIIFNPTFWNIAARSEIANFVSERKNKHNDLAVSICAPMNTPAQKQNRQTKLTTHNPLPTEYHNKTITRIFNNNPRLGCYALAATIFSLGILRDYIYAVALSHQPSSPLLTTYLTPATMGLPSHLHNLFPPIPPSYLAYALLAAGNTLVLTSMYALGITGTYLGDYFGILMDEPVTSFPFNVVGAPMYVGSVLSFAGTAVHWGKPAGLALTGLVAVAYFVACRWEDPFTGEIYAKRDRERKQGKKGK
ncbi:MAG: Phosphatidyl-N-methylethanolamine N-methyltransferase [Alyxoria varia]|nr:MAG: Phosphatidyl-N-methylethanolamine N-methyltransferase [Alyxoria varia]